MKILRKIIIPLLLVALAWAANPVSAASTGELLQQGIYAEEVDGNMDAAIKIYAQIITNSAAPGNHIAQALYRQGMCYLKTKDEPAARADLEKLVTEYPGQTEMVEKARPVLDDLTDFDPAALMPAGTLVYAELGTPGNQIETILTMLKGTPYENPLAAIGGQPGKGPGGKSPQDIMAALMNPSMLAEFKKIRGAAIGITRITNNNPPFVVALYPGKSDALRGLIIAALGMAGTPGETIAGMQTVNFKNTSSGTGAAYDDTVIIVAQPASQLAWCVKQYKGAISEPTHASGNKLFQKLNRSQRQKNALTLWANVSDSYTQLLKMFPAGGIPPGILKADSFVDFSNMDGIVLTQSVEPGGLGLTVELQFKDGHHCLPYDLIRTPNLGKSPLEAVPAEAIAVASFALNPADPAQTEKVRAEIQSATGLDIGRELFANIEQVTFFVLPAEENAADAKLPAVILNHLGLAITSRNPGQTREVIDKLLGVANLVSPGGKNPRCSMDQVNGITLLSLNPEIVKASVAAIQNRKSICEVGPLNGVVLRLNPAASKLVGVNVGGALRLLKPQMKFGNLDREQAAKIDASFEQLARATELTTVELRTDEELNSFAVDSDVAGIPPLNEVLGPLTQIQQITQQARAAAAAKELQLERPATILPASSAPVMDGTMDEIWKSARPYPLANLVVEPPAGGGKPAAEYRALWDENNLYLLVDVTDSILRNEPDQDLYQSDGIEVYIDATNGKAAEFGDTDYQYAVVWDKTTPKIKEFKHDRTNDVQYVVRTTDKGYCVAMKFPWRSLGTKPSAGAKIGLEVQVNDDQGHGHREAKITWHDQHDQAWQTPQAFGNAELAGLVGWWKFDETQGTNALDSSGGNHTGRLVGNAKWAPGKVGGALALDGAGSFVQIADKSAFDLSGQTTLACWVNIHSVPAEWAAIITKGDSAWRLSTYQRESKFHFSVGTALAAGLNGSAAINTNEWHHLAAVYDGSVQQIYIDGKLDATQPWTGGIASNDADVLIGENSEQTQRFFDGLIDDVRVYNYALSENQIKALANTQ
jgi:hypothetical protein